MGENAGRAVARTARQHCPKDLSLGLRFNQNTASKRSGQNEYFMGEGRLTQECEGKEENRGLAVINSLVMKQGTRWPDRFSRGLPQRLLIPETVL